MLVVRQSANRTRRILQPRLVTLRLFSTKWLNPRLHYAATPTHWPGIQYTQVRYGSLRWYSTPAYSGEDQHGAVTQRYDEMVAEERIRNDPAQRFLMRRLDHLYDEIVAAMDSQEKAPSRMGSSTSWIGKTFSGIWSNDSDEQAEFKSVRGLYIHGGPGSGKTFCMDMFFDAVPIQRKRRVHFHEFMAEVHNNLHAIRKRNGKGMSGDEMMKTCVNMIHSKSWLLCFDEFQVTNIGDAMILKVLFDMLFAKGVVVVATSNREPDELYKNGLQRELFEPFIQTLKLRCRVENMQSEVDYRMVQNRNASKDTQQVFFVADQDKGIKSGAQFERLWDRLSKGQTVNDMVLRLQGRTLAVPSAGKHTDIARFTFHDLCVASRGTADYTALAATFHTIFVENVPKLDLHNRNELRRFINLVDVLYEKNVVLVISSQVPVNQLLDGVETTNSPEQETTARAMIDEVFAFERTLSRLHEMQKPEYLERIHLRVAEGKSPIRFLNQVLGKQSLTEGDIRLLWDRYDDNDDGEIDSTELETMLREMMLYRSGHDHVTDEMIEETRKLMIEPGSKQIRWESFRDYVMRVGAEVF